MSKQVSLIDGVIVIKVLNNPYEIPLSGIDTPDKLIRCIYGLSSKTWVTNEVIYQVMKIAGGNSDQIKLG